MPRSSERRRRQLLGAALGAATLPFSSRAAPARDTVLLGQSVPLSGPAQHLGIEYQRGLRLALDAAQAAGQLGGRQVELLSLDDQYEPEVAQENTRQLLQDGALALVGYVGTEATQRCLPLAVQAGVAMVAPLTGAEALRQRPARALVHLRPGLLAETGLIARTLATVGLQRVAVLQQGDGDGAAGLAALRESLQAAGLPTPLLVASVARNSTGLSALQQTDVAEAAQRLLSAQPQAVVFLCAYGSTAGVLRLMRQRGWAGGAYATSLSSAAAMGALLGPLAAGLSVTQVMPSPGDTSRPLVAAFQQRLKASGGPTAEYASLEGWVAGLLVAEALRRMPRGGGRESFLAALESLGGHDLGGLVLRWDPLRRQALSQVSLTVLDSLGRPLR